MDSIHTATQEEQSHSSGLLWTEQRPYQVVHRYRDSRYWSWTERIRGHQAWLQQEKFISVCMRKDPEIAAAFQSRKPGSNEFLLHYLAAVPRSSKPPVLLVHGAAHDANLSWCESIDKKKGLLYALAGSGRDVFAITFAHPHGDNVMQAIQLGNAIHRVQELTGAAQVDLVAHSKGGIVAWSYLSGLAERYGAGYGGEVARCLLLGSPNRGIDYPFRHLAPNWLVLQLGVSAPIVCSSMMVYGYYMDTVERSIYQEGGAFPGQLQILSRWDDRVPVKPHARMLYEGGQHWLFSSRGIDAALAEGGDFMARLCSSPVDPEVELHLLAGNKPFFHGIWTEWDAPSDGLVFVESVLDTSGLSANDRQIKRKTVLPLNHLELLYHPLAQQWVLAGLQAEKKERSFMRCTPNTLCN